MKIPYKRHSIRLKDYDYSSDGAYYVTLCAQERKCLFGEVINDGIVLNDAGKMIEYNWNKLPQRFLNIELDEFITMPNHFHGIINVTVGAPLVGAQNDNIIVGAQNNNRAGTRPAPTLGDIVGAFKSITTNEYIRNVKNNHWRQFDKQLWQRNYYEHIIRNDIELNEIRGYIKNNPYNWEEDKEYVKNG